jgi:hypothetical protein
VRTPNAYRTKELNLARQAIGRSASRDQERPVNGWFVPRFSASYLNRQRRHQGEQNTSCKPKKKPAGRRAFR